jgi:hypothetical protein
MAMQFRVTEYKLVSTQGVSELDETVNRLLARGWVPHGDTKVVYGSAQLTYAQAMVKVEAINVNVNQPTQGSSILVPQ